MLACHPLASRVIYFGGLGNVRRETYIQNVLEVIGSITREFNVRGSYPFKQYSLGRPHIDIMFLLSQTESMNIKEFSERLNVTSGAVTQFVDYLEDRKLVSKIENPIDRRSRLVSLTPEAQHELKAFRNVYYSTIAHKFESLSDDELESIHRILSKIRRK